MILTGGEIERQIIAGEITISPFDRRLLNPNSYNYRLGNTYIEVRADQILDSREPNIYDELKTIPDNGLILDPANFYLFNTVEAIGSRSFVTSLIGRSSMGRLGVYLQISANLGHQGEIHRWTLEIRCVRPVRLYPGMVVGQVTFWTTGGDVFPSQGYYGSKDDPTISRGLK